MLLIAHRGNTEGPNKKLENRPEYILKTMSKGYSCEIDVWVNKNRIYLGHDSPEYEVDLKFLQNDKLWCHAKNLNALEYMLSHDVHCFWHQKDDYTITSKGVIWTYPGNVLTNNSICVMPEQTIKEINASCCLGICTDFPERYR